MKVSELIKALEELDPEAEVILSTDAEGNAFSPAYETSTQHYFPENTWSGVIVDEEDMPYYEYAEEVVVIWPTN